MPYYPTYNPYSMPSFASSIGSSNYYPNNSNSQVIWVQGEQAAKSYPVAPGNQVLLFDSDDPVFYVKKADVNGRPLPLEIYDFKKREIESNLQEEETIEYATSDDVRRIIKEELDIFRKSQYKSKEKEVK